MFLIYIIVIIGFEVFFSCCCMGDINIVVENVFILCDNNVLCSVKCYGGYIFFSGYMEEFYRY